MLKVRDPRTTSFAERSVRNGPDRTSWSSNNRFRHVDPCSKSLDPIAVTSDQVTAALKYVQYKAMYSSNGARQGWLGGPLGGALGGLGVMGGGFNGVNHNQALNNAMLSGQNINSLIGLQMMNNPGASLADYSQLQSLAGSQDSYQQNVQDQLVANAMGLNTGKSNLIQVPP